MSVLAIWDANEYEQLVGLAHGEAEAFAQAAQKSASFTEHVEGYGIVLDARGNPSIRIALVHDFLAKVPAPSKTEPAITSDEEGVRAELSRRRNAIEIALRRKLADGLAFKHGPKGPARLYASLTDKRREQLAGLAYEKVWDELYFDELRSVIDHNWDAFEAFFHEEKAPVVGWMDHINRCRADAHARALKPDDLTHVRTCFTRLEEKLNLSS